MPEDTEAGSENGVDDDRSLSTKIDDMEERMDVQDEDIRALREDLEEQLDVLDGRIRRIESGAVDVESARKLFEYIVDVEEQIATLRERLETAIDAEAKDELT